MICPRPIDYQVGLCETSNIMTPNSASIPQPQPTPTAPAKRRRLLGVFWWLLIWPICLLLTLWEGMAINYSNLPHWLSPMAAAAVAVAALASLVFLKPRWRALAVFVLLFAFIVVGWEQIPPSNDRDWQKDVTILPWAEFSGDRVTIHNIRNCNYRSETDFDVRHYDRSFDLDKLRSVDLMLVHWGSPHIAHTMLSFGFEGDQYLCFSIETRKRVGQTYSTIEGFFKQYELTYVVADERDLVRLRTNYRGEQVYIYRLKATPQLRREVLLGYLQAVNSLHDRPEWYNALTSNCTTNIRRHIQPFTHGAWDWRMLLNGHLHELIYERGAVDTTLPQPELQARCLVNDRAKTAGDDEDFSRRIRVGLPGIMPVAAESP